MTWAGQGSPVMRFLLATLTVAVLYPALGSAAAYADPCAPADRVSAHDVCRAADRQPAYRQSFWDQFRDPEDGMFDTSEWNAKQTGVLPVPIIITEPAVGLGGGVALTLFHDTDKGADGRPKRGPTGKPVPPSISLLGGLATENGTWGVFGGHLGIWKDDRIRYTGAAGFVSMNLDYYGIASQILGKPFAFNIEGLVFLQDLQFRLGNTPLFAGVRYVYFHNKVEFERLLPIPGIEPVELDSALGGAGVDLMFDTRDNIITPNRGVFSKAQVMLYDEALGGDFAYVGVEAFVLAWTPITSCLNLGLRLDLRYAEYDAPFYALPFIDLRGIPAMRYQGHQVAVFETELRWDITRRWSLVGFGGVGRAARDFSDLSEFFQKRNQAQNAWNAGGGFRYLLARRLGLRAGLDIARGPEEWAFYITVGSAWIR